MKKILIVEDDIDIHNLIKSLLDSTYTTLDAYSGTEAMLVLEKYKVDLILLDLMLPGINGEELIKKYPAIPIIVISAKSGVEDKVQALKIGARDFITKPFHTKELLARIEVQLREHPQAKTYLEYKALRLDTEHFIFSVAGEPISLTKTEFFIMKQFLLNPTQILSKSRLLDLLYLETLDGDEGSLKVHISNIRRKLKTVTNEDYIEAVWGIGYKLI